MNFDDTLDIYEEDSIFSDHTTLDPSKAGEAWEGLTQSIFADSISRLTATMHKSLNNVLSDKENRKRAFDLKERSVK